MTAQIAKELDELIDLSKAAASEMNSKWQPRCVARTFASRTDRTFILTMQAWLDLDAIESPILDGELPPTDEAFHAALAAFGVPATDLTADEMFVLADEMLLCVHDAFAMSLRMAQPDTTPGTEADGFGQWLPVYSCLKTQCGFSRVEALSLPVGEAFATIAGMRRNMGWRVVGEPYATRDTAKAEESDSTPPNEAQSNAPRAPFDPAKPG